MSSWYIGKSVNFDPGGMLISYIIEYLMLKSKQCLSLKKTMFDKFLCLLIKFIHDHKKMCLAAKILGNLHFLIVFLGSPLNFDKEK